MRNIITVIDRVLRAVPDKDNGGFKFELRSLRSSALYTAPEIMGIAWERFARIFNQYIPYPAKEQWMMECIDIFTDKANQ